MNHAQFATLTRAWNHVGVYNPRTIARLARLGVDPEIAGTVAPNRRLWGANIEAGFISPDSFAAMTSRLHNAYVTTAKINGRKAAEQLDLFAARAPQKVAQGGFATDATKAYAADVRPELPARFPQGAPLIVSYGGGVDSTGVLVEFVRRGIRPDLILFADTGGEHPETYLYLDVMDAFLVRHGFPKITRVRKTVTTAEYDSLYSNCVSKAMLPSIAYGSHKHSCSLKWKVEPMDAYIRRHFPPVAAAVKNKRRIEAVRVIGYDAGPADVRRMERLEGETVDANVRWHYWYPLQEWGWDRERTLSEIVRAGLPPPPKSACFFCIAGETEVVTREGVKPIRDLAGGKHWLLVPSVGSKGGLGHRGGFQEVDVRSFGVQPLYAIKMHRGSASRVIRATAEHRWFLAADEGVQWTRMSEFERTTASLKPGDRLRPLRAIAPGREEIMPVAVAQGFVFGDGSRPSTFAGAASLVMYAIEKDSALLPFFGAHKWRRVGEGDKSRVHIHGLPRFWKDRPPLDESRSFLLSWLAGYFAADGSVSKKGQPVLESASREALELARSICAICGVGYSAIRSRMRVGFAGRDPSPLYRLCIRSADLPEWFFVIAHHRENAARAAEKVRRDYAWIVDSVTPLNLSEEVFCAVVPGAQAFGLSEDLMTGNCPSQKPWELIELAIRSPDLAWQVIQMERAAGPNLDTLDGLWRAPVRGDADAQPRPGSMTEFLLEWMADGRAYAALPSLSAPGVSPTEVRASKVIGKVYRRRLPVAGQDPDLGAAAIEELKVQGRQASAYLGALYQRTFGPYVRASSIAEMAASVNSAIGRLTTAKRALDKAARAGKATDKESAAYVRALASYEDALASYNHARLARGATDTAMARTRAMFDRGRAKAAIRAATRAAASARKRRSTADLAVADADFAVALDWLLRLHREQGKSEKFIAKEQRGFVAKYNSGAETSDDDDAEGDE